MIWTENKDIFLIARLEEGPGAGRSSQMTSVFSDCFALLPPKNKKGNKREWQFLSILKKTWIGNSLKMENSCTVPSVQSGSVHCMDINRSWLRMALLGMLQLKTLQNNSADRIRLFIIKSTLVLKLTSFLILSNICWPIPWRLRTH